MNYVLDSSHRKALLSQNINVLSRLPGQPPQEWAPRQHVNNRRVRAKGIWNLFYFEWTCVNVTLQSNALTENSTSSFLYLYFKKSCPAGWSFAFLRWSMNPLFLLIPFYSPHRYCLHYRFPKYRVFGTAAMQFNAMFNINKSLLNVNTTRGIAVDQEVGQRYQNQCHEHI